MVKSEAFWKIFENTGHVGAYLLYKDYSDSDDPQLASQQKCTNLAGGKS